MADYYSSRKRATTIIEEMAKKCQFTRREIYKAILFETGMTEKFVNKIINDEIKDGFFIEDKGIIKHKAASEHKDLMDNIKNDIAPPEEDEGGNLSGVPKEDQ